MTYEDFVKAEKAIEKNYPKFFSAGKKLVDYIVIVFNIHTGYKRYEWVDEKGLPENIKNDVMELISLLEESK